MAVCNTRLDSFTVSVDTSTIDGCNGGTRNLSYTRRFTRTTWDMLNCSSQETPSSSSSSVNDTRNSLISWSTNIGNITNSSSAGSGKAVTVGKNTPSSDSGSSSRTITVTGSSTFRGSTATDTASVGQSGVGGSYRYWYTTQVGQTNYRVTCSGGPSFGCDGGSYSAAAKHDYKDRTYYRWQDVCGVNYDSWNYYSDSSTYTTTDYTYSGSFPDISSAGGSNSDSWSKSGYAGSCSWSQSCSSPSTVYTYGTGTASAQGPCAGGSVSLSSSNIPYTATTTYGDGSTASTTGYTAGTASVTIDSCNDSCTKTGNVTATKGSIDYTITQSNCSSDCPTVYYYGSTIPTEGSPIGLPLMYWSPSDDYPLNTFSVSYTGDGITSTEFITSSSLIPGQTVNVLLVKFSANTGTSSRTFNVHLSTSVSSDCTWDNTYTQDGKSCTIAFTMSSGCSSGSEHVNFKAYDVCEDYANDVVNWTITFNGNTYNGTSFGIPSSTGQSGIDESWENSDRNKVTGNATVNWSLSNHPSVTGQSTVTFGTCDGCVAGTYSYTIHVSKLPCIGALTDTYDIYLCRTQQISNPLEAQSLALSGGTKLEKVGDYYSVCDFEVDGSGNLVRLIGATNLINFVPTGGGNVVTTDFAIDKGYYICAVQQTDPTKFCPFSTLASLRTGTDIKCKNYTQEVDN
jgi:hypothetical protein